MLEEGAAAPTVVTRRGRIASWEHNASERWDGSLVLSPLLSGVSKFHSMISTPSSGHSFLRCCFRPVFLHGGGLLISLVQSLGSLGLLRQTCRWGRTFLMPREVCPSVEVTCTHGSFAIGLISNWARFKLGSILVAFLPKYLPN